MLYGIFIMPTRMVCHANHIPEIIFVLLAPKKKAVISMSTKCVILYECELSVPCLSNACKKMLTCPESQEEDVDDVLKKFVHLESSVKCLISNGDT